MLKNQKAILLLNVVVVVVVVVVVIVAVVAVVNVATQFVDIRLIADDLTPPNLRQCDG